MLRVTKTFGQRVIYRRGGVARILRGPLRGYRYRVTERSGWAAIWGGWEPAAQRLYQELLKPGQTVYDLGANTGVHSMLFAKLVGQSGVVYAIEPLPANAQEIVEVLSLNRISNVQIVEKAVSDGAGHALFRLGAHAKVGTLSTRGEQSDETIEVGVETLDGLVDAGLRPPEFIKMDIEGTEGAALHGGKGLLEKGMAPTWSIELHTPEQDIECSQFLAERDYKMYRFDPDQLFGRVRLTEVRKSGVGWPDPDGAWGAILAIHRSNVSELRKISSHLAI